MSLRFGRPRTPSRIAISGVVGMYAERIQWDVFLVHSWAPAFDIKKDIIFIMVSHSNQISSQRE